MHDNAHQSLTGESRKVSIEDDVPHEAVPLIPGKNRSHPLSTHISPWGLLIKVHLHINTRRRRTDHYPVAHAEVRPQAGDISMTG